ncbi:MAG: tyrosine--tRNA ligase [Candidatus Pacebacteria bacterium]|nr:tyrosine--tRNA ligase [Candidatus Paceibacterota bacterium]
MSINTNPEKIKELLERGVEEVIDKSHLETALKSGKKLRIYYGIDPTGSNIHIGHAIVLWKLRAFQELGHEVILLIGDFTARIGDPTDKEAARQPLTKKQVEENMRNYKEQASLILDFKKTKLKYNSEWLSKLNFEKILELASHISVQRMLERDMFEKRLKDGKTISLHEFLYPLMQGYDSVAMNVDVEIAGNDQLFNMLTGRDLQKIYNKKDKAILTSQLLLGTDGRKMSKTFGNTIPIAIKPNDMFGKVMSIKDELIGGYFELCTQMPMEEVNQIKQDLQNQSTNPRDLKVKLAFEIVRQYHGEKKAKEAEEEFEKVHQRGELPNEITEWKATKGEYNILDLLFETGLTASKGEAKRMILGKAVEINGQTKNDWQEIIKIENGIIIQVGKRKFLKILPKN